MSDPGRRLFRISAASLPPDRSSQKLFKNRVTDPRSRIWAATKTTNEPTKKTAAAAAQPATVAAISGARRKGNRTTDGARAMIRLIA